MHMIRLYPLVQPGFYESISGRKQVVWAFFQYN